jgi:hypothetical protein
MKNNPELIREVHDLSKDYLQLVHGIGNETLISDYKYWNPKDARFFVTRKLVIHAVNPELRNVIESIISKRFMDDLLSMDSIDRFSKDRFWLASYMRAKRNELIKVEIAKRFTGDNYLDIRFRCREFQELYDRYNDIKQSYYHDRFLKHMRGLSRKLILHSHKSDIKAAISEEITGEALRFMNGKAIKYHLFKDKSWTKKYHRSLKRKLTI